MFCQGPIAKYTFIKEHRFEFSVSLMCAVLLVSRSGFYSWLNRKSNRRDQSNQLLDVKIKSVFAAHYKRYGAPRITRALRQENETCSETRVAIPITPEDANYACCKR